MNTYRAIVKLQDPDHRFQRDAEYETTTFINGEYAGRWFGDKGPALITAAEVLGWEWEIVRPFTVQRFLHKNNKQNKLNKKRIFYLEFY